MAGGARRRRGPRGPGHTQDLLERVVGHAQLTGAAPAPASTTPYINTIPPQREPEYPVDEELERRVRSLMRWNAIAMVFKANQESSELGGHIASYQSAAMLYEVGFNHFWRAPSDDHGGDLIYMQGHSSPGIYARAFLEGRLTEEQVEGFRQEVSRNGLSSYPHPWLMPDYWQFPTVSMGLGPIMAIYQARFMKYLAGREVADTAGRKVWAFLGDGETDEPESLGAISLAGRERLDNLIFVINCNLQRLDGPVRGNGKIIQELETVFRGSGWNVVKVVWGSRLGRSAGARPRRPAAGSGWRRPSTAITRPTSRATAPMFASTSSGRIRAAGDGRQHERRGDVATEPRRPSKPHKVYAAYAAAVQHEPRDLCGSWPPRPSPDIHRRSCWPPGLLILAEEVLAHVGAVAGLVVLIVMPSTASSIRARVSPWHQPCKQRVP